MVKDALFGEPHKGSVLWDIDFREGIILVMLVIPSLFIGLHPGPALRLVEQPVQHLLAQVSFLALGR
jgi:NADH:ubiquinone oxidoreductase subunit 4 (subunit M)